MERAGGGKKGRMKNIQADLLVLYSVWYILTSQAKKEKKSFSAKAKKDLVLIRVEWRDFHSGPFSFSFSRAFSLFFFLKPAKPKKGPLF